MDERYSSDFKKIWGQIIAKTWMDKEFRDRVVQDTEEVLKEFGLEIPNNVKYVVNEERADQNKVIIMLQLPEKPEDLNPEGEERPDGDIACCCCCC